LATERASPEFIRGNDAAVAAEPRHLRAEVGDVEVREIVGRNGDAVIVEDDAARLPCAPRKRPAEASRGDRLEGLL